MRNEAVRLIIHAGTHKTGTSSIQRVLTVHREWLRTRGLHYPDPSTHFSGKQGNHRLFAAVPTGVRERELRAAENFADALRRNARAGVTILLSSEAIYRHVLGIDNLRAYGSIDCYHERRRGYLAALAGLLHGFNAEALIFFRPPADYAESMFHALVADHGWAHDFATFLRDFAPLFDYRSQIEAFQASFVQVKIARYDPHASVAGFFEQIGFDPPALAAEPRLRRSPDRRLSLWLATMNRRNFGDKALLREQRRFIRSADAASLFSSNERTTLWQSESDRRAFDERHSAGLPGRFFPAEPPRALIPVQLSAEDSASISQRFTQWMQARTSALSRALATLIPFRKDAVS